MKVYNVFICSMRGVANLWFERDLNISKATRHNCDDVLGGNDVQRIIIMFTRVIFC